MGKTKIELFEEKLLKEGISDDGLQEYGKLLKRAGNDWNRIQHCFRTAYFFPVKRISDAERLIEFGISNYGSERGCRIPAYEMLGTLYERAGLYKKAYDIYVAIYPDIGGFRGRFPWCLLDTKMHIDNFKYSEELKQYYELCLAEPIFSKTFIQNQFLLNLAEYIIADYCKDLDGKRKAFDAIHEMVEPGYRGALYKLLKRHKHEEKLIITKETKAFLKCMAHDITKKRKNVPIIAK